MVVLAGRQIALPQDAVAEFLVLLRRQPALQVIPERRPAHAVRDVADLPTADGQCGGLQLGRSHRQHLALTRLLRDPGLVAGHVVTVERAPLEIARVAGHRVVLAAFGQVALDVGIQYVGVVATPCLGELLAQVQQDRALPAVPQEIDLRLGAIDVRAVDVRRQAGSHGGCDDEALDDTLADEHARDRVVSGASLQREDAEGIRRLRLLDGATLALAHADVGTPTIASWHGCHPITCG